MTIYELDPDGDVMLHLQYPNAPFAVWNENEELPCSLLLKPLELSDQTQNCRLRGRKSKGKKKKNQTVEETTEGCIPTFSSLDPGRKLSRVQSALDFEALTSIEPTPIHNDPNVEGRVDDNAENYASNHAPEEHSLAALQATDLQPEQEVGVSMQLSSKHLTMASVYFKTMLHGSWKESATSPDSCYTITASEWDPEALLILMNILHGHVRSVPRLVSLEMLAKIAVLVDYYKCHEAVELFVDCWILNLSLSLPIVYSRDLILWLTVSWVFSHTTIFEAMTRVAARQCKGPLQTLGLPIPESIVEAIEQQRQNVVYHIIFELHNLLSYLHERDKCSFECSSMLIGALTKHMHMNGLLHPKPTRPFLGYSAIETTTATWGFKSPNWGSIGSSHDSASSCNLTDFLNPTVNAFVECIMGFKLEEFRR